MYTAKNLEGKTPEELVKIILELEHTIGEKDNALKNQKNDLELTVKINEGLQEQVETLSKNPPAAAETDPKSGISKETFVFEKKKYGFKKLRVYHKDQTIEAAEVLASKSLQKELVSIGSGMVYFIEDVK